MTLPLSIPALFGGALAVGYPIARSIRFNANASSYLTKTFNAGGNVTNWTTSFWIKRTKLDVMQRIFAANSNPAAFADATYTGLCSINATNNMTISGGATLYRTTSMVFRDPTAWMHLVIDANFTVYVNGVSQTFTTNVNPTLRPINTAIPHFIGQTGGNPSQFNETYLAEMNFVDGQNLPPTAFGLTDPITGVWSPKKYSGNYGTTGFYLPFTDNSSNAALGKDFSGMSNLLPVSDVFTNTSYWVHGNSVVLTSGQADPLGGTGAYKLAVGAGVTGPYIYALSSMTAGQPTTATVYAKAGEVSELLFYNGTANGGYAYFNLSNGTIYGQGNIATGSGVSPAIQSVGGGWYKCSVTVISGVTSNEAVLAQSINATTTNGQGIYLFRVCCTVGSVVPNELQYTNGAAVPNKDFSVYNITANDWNNDCLVDTPTNYGTDNGLGGEVRGNYCVFNPVDTHTPTYMMSHNGNLEPQNLVNSVWTTARATMFVSSGKWYWENIASLGAEGLMMAGIMGQGTYLAGRTDSVHLGQIPDGYGYFNMASGGGTGVRTYTLSNETGDISGATDGCKKLVQSGAVAGSLPLVILSGATKTLYAVSNVGDPGASYINGSIKVEVRVNSLNQDTWFSVRAHRVSAGAIVASGTVTAEQEPQFAPITLTFNTAVDNLGTWGANDRLLIEYKFRAQTGGSNLTISLGSTDSEVVANISTGAAGGYKYNNNVGVAYGAPYVANDVIGVAFDADNGILMFYKNGVAQGTAYSGIPMNVPYAPAVSLYQTNSSGAYAVCNFGQKPFSYPAPVGYKVLCAQNIPQQAVDKPSQHFDVHLRTGTNAPFSVSGKGFSPDLVWSKSRASVENHGLWDSVRGATLELFTPANAAEATLPSGISSFDATGYSANIGTWPRLNAAGISLVEWLWNKSPTAGFDILTYVKSATTNQAVAHGLGAVPAMIMVRQRNGGNIYFWHKSLTGTEYLDICTTIARTTNAGIFYQAPDSSNFYLGNAWGGSGAANHVAWVWSEVPGFSRFGTYYGNGVVDGPFVWTGFRPKWLMRKRLDTAANWWAQDGVRSPINPTNNLSALNLTDTEFVTTYETDFLANGFKVRNTSNNQAGGLYLFAAFAENPFKHARAR